MEFLGFLVCGIGVVAWFAGTTWLTDRTLRLHGMERRRFPFSPFVIPFRKFDRQAWALLAAICLVSMLLLNIGTAMLQ